MSKEKQMDWLDQQQYGKMSQACSKWLETSLGISSANLSDMGGQWSHRTDDHGEMLVLCLAPSELPHGAFSMLNFSDCPNAAAESSLSQVLIPEQDVPSKYYLSAAAAKGILRRLEGHHDKMPRPLVEAFRQAALNPEN